MLICGILLVTNKLCDWLSIYIHSALSIEILPFPPLIVSQLDLLPNNGEPWLCKSILAQYDFRKYSPSISYSLPAG